ncbi:MAG TPA: ABC transporter permease [Solirubrobacteraceae bacterium]|nr:ABC transporter permease [Solirubrobacteraceae bacterium]
MRAGLAHVWFLGVRRFPALIRQPLWIPLSLAQPLAYLLLYSAVFREIANIPGFEGDSYATYLAPGIVIIASLFSGGWAGMNMVYDLDSGVVDRFLVTPVTRTAVIGGRLVEESILAAIKGIGLAGVGVAIGATLHGGLLGLTILVLCAVVLCAAFAALSIAVALTVRRADSVVAMTQLLLLPLTFASTTFMQRDLMPGWAQTVSRLNPVDWAVVAGRGVVAQDQDWGSVLAHSGYLLAFFAVSIALAAQAFRVYRRSV